MLACLAYTIRCSDKIMQKNGGAVQNITSRHYIGVFELKIGQCCRDTGKTNTELELGEQNIRITSNLDQANKTIRCNLCVFA